jgi:hypothetical protein
MGSRLGAEANDSLAADADYRRQFTTVVEIRRITTAIAAFVKEQGHPPAQLSEEPFASDYGGKAGGVKDTYAKDGWGRPLYYYSNSRTYVLASFGRDGLPDAQRSVPGRSMTEIDFDSDMVWVGDGFAQTPRRIDP